MDDETSLGAPGNSEDAPLVPSPSEETGNADQPVAIRDSLGKFVKGSSGNPAGRKKGTKNYIKQQQQALEAAVRTYINTGKGDEVQKAIDRLFKIISKGDDKTAVNALKLLMEITMTKPKDATEEQGKGNKEIRVIIENSTPGKSTQGNPVTVVVDGDFEDITEED